MTQIIRLKIREGNRRGKKKTERDEKEKCLFVQRLIKLTELRAIPRDSTEVLCSQNSEKDAPCR